MTADNNVVTIKVSDEANKFKNNAFPIDGGPKASLRKEPFDRKIMDILSRPREQKFPDCKVNNKLGYEECNGSKVYTLTSNNYDKVILCIHGGGWVDGLTKNTTELFDALATNLNAKAYIPLYPLTPESNSEETYKVIEGLYKEILKEGKDIYLAGESAGGNIVLGLMYTIKAQNLEKPKKLVIISPCTDLTFSNKEIPLIEKRDPILVTYSVAKGAELWAGKDNLNHPKNSAVYADVSGYPDTMIIQGTDDILYADCMILYNNMKNAGVNVKLVKGEGLWHVFPIFPIPEREKTVALIKNFCLEDINNI